MKRLIFVLLMIAMLMLTGCGMEVGGEIDIHFERDSKTGVYYVLSDHGICPRYNADGTLYTGGAE